MTVAIAKRVTYFKLQLYQYCLKKGRNNLITEKSLQLLMHSRTSPRPAGGETKIAWLGRYHQSSFVCEETLLKSSDNLVHCPSIRRELFSIVAMKVAIPFSVSQDHNRGQNVTTYFLQIIYRNTRDLFQLIEQ